MNRHGIIEPFDRAPVTLRGSMYHEMFEQLSGDHPQPHAHSHSVLRPVWERLWLRFVARLEFPYWMEKIVRVECSGDVLPGGDIKYRTWFDAEDLSHKIVAWRQWQCLEPSLPDSHGVLIRYAAMKVPTLESDKAALEA